MGIIKATNGKPIFVTLTKNISLPRLNNVARVTDFAIGRDQLGPCLNNLFQRQGLRINEIRLDNIAKIRLLGMGPTLEQRIEKGHSIDKIFSSLGLSLFQTEDRALYILGDEKNIAMLTKPTDKAEERELRFVLTPQEVLEMYEKGSMPPIGSMIQIPGGEFEAGNRFGNENEKPVHRVKISPFLISPYQVTNYEFKKFVEAGGYTEDKYWSKAGIKWRESQSPETPQEPKYWEDQKFNRIGQPVVGISWYEAEAYLNWAGQRFPTEHEWEYAARGGLKGKNYPWGDDEPAGKARFEEKKVDSPEIVDNKSYAPNGFGLFHMAGNVWEWVQDWYHENYYQKLKDLGIVENPKGPEKGRLRVLRGGSWISEAGSLRVSERYEYLPIIGNSTNFGFRAAMDLEEE